MQALIAQASIALLLVAAPLISMFEDWRAGRRARAVAVGVSAYGLYAACLAAVYLL